MNIGRMSSFPMRMVRMMDCSKRAGASSFKDLLSDAQQTVQASIHLYLPRENTIFSGGPGTQSVYAEYTADSTAEDPIVRIRGEASSGEYDFTCHINDIDPKQASYAEMCALWGHLRSTGEISFQFGGSSRPVIPYGVDTGDVTQKQNYMDKINRMTTSQMFDSANQISARELLGIYQNFIDKRQQKIEDAGVEMEASSSVAYAARMEKSADTMALTDPTKDPTLRAAYDQLSTASKDVLDRMNSGQANITQDEWTNLCRELKDAGMITESDFMCTRADLRTVPLGYMDDGGNVVYYDNSPLLSSGLLGTETRLSGYSGLKSLWTVEDWSGDPLKYFDQWIESLRNWRSDLAAEKNADGTRKYGDLSHLGNDINSCQKVTNLVRDLMSFPK